MFDWEDLRHFAALADAGTLSGAARTLKVDHATVGRRVSGLERSLGRVLVERLPKRWMLTEVGRDIAALAQIIQAEAHAVERTARARHASLSGVVTVSAPPVFASHFLAPRLPALRRLYPGLHLSLMGQQATASLHQQDADIAIRITRPSEAGTLTRRVGGMQFWLYAAPGYQERPPSEWQFLAYDVSLDHVPEQQWLRTFAAGRPIVFRSNDLASQAAAARVGMGIAALPCFLAQGDAGLVPLSVDLTPVTRDIHLVIHADLRKMAAVRAVMNYIATQISEGMPPRRT